MVAIRNKLLLITRKHNKPSGVAGVSLLSSLSESPVEEFQYIRVGFLFPSILSRPGCPEQRFRSSPGAVPLFHRQLGSPHLQYPSLPQETKAKAHSPQGTPKGAVPALRTSVDPQKLCPCRNCHLVNHSRNEQMDIRWLMEIGPGNKNKVDRGREQQGK